MLSAYLYLNALLYVVFAAWMTFFPWNTARAIGFSSLSNGGRSEYLVIYGGLQVGFALFFAHAARSAAMQRVALLIAGLALLIRGTSPAS